MPDITPYILQEAKDAGVTENHILAMLEIFKRYPNYNLATEEGLAHAVKEACSALIKESPKSRDELTAFAKDPELQNMLLPTKSKKRKRRK